MPDPADTLQISGGRVTLGGPVIIQGRLNWSGGRLQGGSLTVASNAIVVLSGAHDKELTSVTLVNEGQVEWSGAGRLAAHFTGFAQTVLIENRPGATFDAGSDAVIALVTPGYGAERFRWLNQGFFRKSAGDGATTFEGPVEWEQAGRVEVRSGRLVVPQGLVSRGSFDVAAGAAVEFTGGHVRLEAGHEATGEGFFGVAEGTVSLDGVVRGRFDWAGGQWSGHRLLVASNGVLRLRGAADKVLNQFTLENEGRVEWDGPGRLVAAFTGFAQAVLVTNHAGGVFEIRTDTNVVFATPGYGAELARFHNGGVLRKSAGVGTARFEGPFALINEGRLELLTGRLRLDNGLAHSGQAELAAGTALEIGGGTFTLGPTNRVTGAGRCEIPTGSVTVNGRLNDRLDLGGGTVGGTLAVAGVVHWTGSRLQGGAMEILEGGTLALDGDPDKILTQFVLNNGGTTTWSGPGRLVAEYTGYAQTVAITNTAAGLWEIATDAPVVFSSPGFGAELFRIDNRGTLRKRGGVGTNVVEGPVQFLNGGRIEVEQGGVRFRQSLVSAGTWVIAPGAGVELTAGRVDLQPGHAVEGTGFFGLRDGTLSLFGTIHGRFDWTGGTLSAGDFAVGPDGRLLLAGPDDKVLVACTINNAGTISWTGAGRWIGQFTGYAQSILITNLAGALFDLQTPTNLVFATPGYGAELFRVHNSGTLRRSGDAGDARFQGPIQVVNTGEIDLQQGALVLDRGVDSAGPIQVAAGSALRVTGGALTLTSENLFAGNGEVEIPGGNVALNGVVRGRLRVTGGVVSGQSVLAGLIEWEGGWFAAGSLTVATNGVLHLAGAAPKTLNHFTLVNAGTVRWHDTGPWVGQFTGYAQSVLITNLAEGLFLVESDTDLTLSTPGYGAETMRFHNAGILRKAGGPGVTVFAGFSTRNTGRIDLEAGAIDFRGGLKNEGEVRGGAHAAPSADTATGPGDPFRITLRGSAGYRYQVEASANLRDWDLVVLTNAPAAQFQVVDPASPSEVRRYYRARLVD